MKRHTISLGKDRYLVELVKKEDTNDITTKRFRVLSNYVVMNDNIFISDLYFIDPDMVKSRDTIIWPASELSNVPLMSLDPKSYNEGYVSEDTVDSAIENGIIIDTNLCEKEMSVMKARVWHPTTDLNRDKLILYADSYINSIHFHWICKSIKSGENHIGKEQRVNQDIYNEYFEIEIPDFRDFLYNKSFIKDNSLIMLNDFTIGKVKYVEGKSSDSSNQIYKESYDDPNGRTSPDQIIDANLLLQQWRYTKDDEGIEWKEYVTNNTINDNGLSLNITLLPYDYIDDSYTYVVSSNPQPASCQFRDDMKFSITPNIEFVSGMISVIGKVRFPKVFDNIKEAWQCVHNTDFSKYAEMSEKVADNEEAMEILGNDSHMVKYTCIVSSDCESKRIIHTEVAYADCVDDFLFPMKDLFDNWNQVPQNVYITLYIEDRAIGKNCKSDTRMFTKENLKYTINDRAYTRLAIKRKETDIEDMNKENFNFISTLNCRIVRDTTKDNNGYARANISSPRVIYKPLFYRTQDSQNIKIRKNLEQNIGISLSDYMSKVDEFVMKIGENNYNEIARNGAFVIFKVNAKDIESLNGKYDIVTIDNDYVTTGNYSIV